MCHQQVIAVMVSYRRSKHDAVYTIVAPGVGYTYEMGSNSPTSVVFPEVDLTFNSGTFIAYPAHNHSAIGRASNVLGDIFTTLRSRNVPVDPKN